MATRNLETISVETWEELNDKVAEIRAEHSPRPSRSDHLLFRGQANSEWDLSTTLERAGKNGVQVSNYYGTIFNVKAEIECFTEHRWDVPEWPSIRETFSEYDKGSLQLGAGAPASDYLSYLRHHGFPSPIMDWSRSLFVAAFFAFHEYRSSGTAAIFVYLERPEGTKVGGNHIPRISRIGPNIRTHRRHYLQKSEYTLCTEFADGLGGWIFQHHERVFGLDYPEQDRLWKFSIPLSERGKVLMELDNYNLNAFSLFGSEESLMQTIARRAF